MAEYNLGRVAFVDKGAYSAEETYSKWDFVTTVDSTYLFVSTTPQIGKPITDTTFWKCIADGKPATLAAAAATLAKEAANNAATLANDKAGLAQSAATLANTKAGLADDAAILATDKAALADSKATLANDKAILAQSAADNANAKANEFTAAEGLRVTAETGRVTAETSRVTAETGRTTAETARVTAESARNVASNAYNLTVSVPLGSGYYTLATAVAAVAVGLRKKGLVITFESAAGVWETYQFAGASTATWTTLAQWVKEPNQLNVTELLELPIAEVLNVLYAKIQAIEAFIKASQYGNVTADQVDIVRNFNVWGKTNLIIEGTAAPAVLPDFVGQTFVNTVGGVTYTAKGIASVADWKQTSN